VRFLRHLAAVLVIVAVVVLAGLAWNHFAASSLIGAQAQAAAKRVSLAGRPPGGSAGAMAPRPGPRGGRPGSRSVVIRSQPMNLGLSSMLDPVNLAVLRHTVVIEGVVIALVVMADVSRRLWRQERRARRLAEADRGRDR
jgi:hypothetical protein